MMREVEGVRECARTRAAAAAAAARARGQGGVGCKSECKAQRASRAHDAEGPPVDCLVMALVLDHLGGKVVGRSA